jgi:D-psicose/D-tagatose/L-ribulose 3-epimerase
MSIAISNLAWQPEEDAEVLAALHTNGVSQLELAPTKTWPQLDQVPQQEATAYRRQLTEQGFSIVALQSLLFGQPDLVLFGSTEQRRALQSYLEHVIQLGGWLQAQVLVFGSPKNRQRGPLNLEEATDIAVPFFRQLGQVADSEGVWLCIEPNPIAYACDFITTTTDGIDLVKQVNHSGFGLHLDAGGIYLAQEDIHTVIPAAIPFAKHFHISEPNLAPIGTTPDFPHATLHHELMQSGYTGHVSIEMRSGEQNNLAQVERAVHLAQQVYTN